jgi:hypothetical protein
MHVVYSVDLHPSRLLLVHDAVREELNSRLMRRAPHRLRRSCCDGCLLYAEQHARYDESLGGVMLAYWKDKMLDKTARSLQRRARPAG